MTDTARGFGRSVHLLKLEFSPDPIFVEGEKKKKFKHLNKAQEHWLTGVVANIFQALTCLFYSM